MTDAPTRAHRPTPEVPVLRSPVSFEVELLAPPGRARADLAALMAARPSGRVRPVFHAHGASAPEDDGMLAHLGVGLEVLDPTGRARCRLVDEPAIRVDPSDDASVPTGAYRILADDARTLRMVADVADPRAPLSRVLDPVAAALGARVTTVGDARRIDDAAGATVVVATPLPPGHDRPCEVVTEVVARDHRATLEALLLPARSLGFTAPAGATVTARFDAAPLRSVAAFANLVRLFAHWRAPLLDVLRTDPGCRRLGPVPDDQAALVERPWRRQGGWRALAAAVRTVGTSRSGDVDLTGVVADGADAATLAVRLLPPTVDEAAIVARTALVERLVARCRDPRPVPWPVPGNPMVAREALVALAAGRL